MFKKLVKLFVRERKAPPKIYCRKAEIEVKDKEGNIYVRYIKVSERLLWAYEDWHVFFGKKEFLDAIESKIMNLSKGFMDNDKFIFAKDIASITVVKKTETEIS